MERTVVQLYQYYIVSIRSIKNVKILLKKKIYPEIIVIMVFWSLPVLALYFRFQFNQLFHSFLAVLRGMRRFEFYIQFYKKSNQVPNIFLAK